MKNLSLYANYAKRCSRARPRPASAWCVNQGQVFAPYTSRQKEVGVKYDSGKLGMSAALFTVRSRWACPERRVRRLRRAAQPRPRAVGVRHAGARPARAGRPDPAGRRTAPHRRRRQPGQGCDRRARHPAEPGPTGTCRGGRPVAERARRSTPRTSTRTPPTPSSCRPGPASTWAPTTSTRVMDRDVTSASARVGQCLRPQLLGVGGRLSGRRLPGAAARAAPRLRTRYRCRRHHVSQRDLL
jgi:hypothetical protein